MDTSLFKSKATDTDEAFFMERLEMLYEQSLGDLRGFAEREGRTYEEVKRRMSELHCKSLFKAARADSSVTFTERKELIGQILRTVSQQLESLETLAGLQSFLLVVNPLDESDEGFLGGTLKGREFWRGHRGCGAAGAQAFKAQCVRSQPHVSPLPVQFATKVAAAPAVAPLIIQTPPSTSSSHRKGPARGLKAELYGAMRDALRAVSGVRNAEMKWTNHSKLSVYGVELAGWPDDVPHHNPSTLNVTQNKLLLDSLREGKMFFVRTEGAQARDPSAGPSESAPEDDEDAIFEDSIDYSWVVQDAPPGATGTASGDPAESRTAFVTTGDEGGVESTISHVMDSSYSTYKRRRIEET